jgi:hypothetical protein
LPYSERLDESRGPIEEIHLASRYEAHHKGRGAHNLGKRSEIKDGREFEGTILGHSLKRDLTPTTDLNREPSMLRGGYKRATHGPLREPLIEDL